MHLLRAQRVYDKISLLLRYLFGGFSLLCVLACRATLFSRKNSCFLRALFALFAPSDYPQDKNPHTESKIIKNPTLISILQNLTRRLIHPKKLKMMGKNEKWTRNTRLGIQILPKLSDIDDPAVLSGSLIPVDYWRLPCVPACS